MIWVGDAVPAVAVEAGGRTMLADVIGGDAALLIFFKEACGTCHIALPVFQHWSSQVRVIGVSQDDAATTAGFFETYGIAMEVVYDRPDFEASAAFDIEGVPALFLVSGGEITWAWVGWNVTKATELASRIAELAASEPLLVGADALPPLRPG